MVAYGNGGQKASYNAESLHKQRAIYTVTTVNNVSVLRTLMLIEVLWRWIPQIRLPLLARED